MPRQLNPHLEGPVLPHPEGVAFVAQLGPIVANLTELVEHLDPGRILPLALRHRKPKGPVSQRQRFFELGLVALIRGLDFEDKFVAHEMAFSQLFLPLIEVLVFGERNGRHQFSHAELWPTLHIVVLGQRGRPQAPSLRSFMQCL